MQCSGFICICKISKIIDIKDKKQLLNQINIYSQGVYGQNEYCSEYIDRFELDISNPLEGGCNTRELRSNDKCKRVISPKSSNNNCFLKCVQDFIPSLTTKEGM
jgi:hypothetical protein